jgi:hypothetical protein
MKSKSLSLTVITLAVSLLGPAAFAATFSVAPIADAYVATGPTGNLANNNYGGGGALALSGSGTPNGEFQSVLRFDTALLRDSLNTQFGGGQWSIDSVSLRLSSSPHSNAIYNDIMPGLFGASLMQNNSWVEGTGNASAPGATGITYNSLKSTFISPANDRDLGTFSFGGGSSGFNTYTLNLDPGLVADIENGSQLSLRLFGADPTVSYLFSSRAATPTENRPELEVSAVPEPSALALLGLGTLALAVAGNKSRRFRLSTNGE